MDSPVLQLEPQIRAAASLIAPERHDELAVFIAAKGLTIEFTDESHDISVNVDKARVRLGLTSLEHLWAAALFYHCLYSDSAAAQGSGQLQFDTTQYPRTTSSMALLNWATNQWTQQRRTAWPSPLRPRADPTPLGDEHVTNEIFLSAVAWTVHHEYAHIRLSHSNKELVNAHREEKDADLTATDWIFEGAPTAQHLRKRAIGVIVGILALDVLEYAQLDPPGLVHPRAYERLSYCLNRYAQSEEDEAFAFALCGMQFNLEQRGIKTSIDGPSFRSILDDLFVARSTHGRDHQ